MEYFIVSLKKPLIDTLIFSIFVPKLALIASFEYP